MQIRNGHRVLVQTSIFEPDPATLWLEWAKTYGVVIGITVGVAVVAACSYLQSGHTQGRKQKVRHGSYFEARKSTHSEESQRSEEIEESLTDRCGDLRRHLVQLDKKEKKKTEEKRFFGINLTDIQTDIINRDDHEYRCVTPSPAGEQREGETSSKELMPPPKLPVGKAGNQQSRTPRSPNAERDETPPYCNNARRFQHVTHHQAESSYSSESTFSKSSTVVNHEKGAQSRFTKETNVTTRSNTVRRRRASSFRRMSSGDVVDNW